MKTKLIAPFLLTLVLTACGGGGGGSASSNQTAPSTPVSTVNAALTITQGNTVYTETVGDVNNDGLEDVVISGWNYDTHTAYVYLLTQNTDGTLTDKTSLLGNNVIGGSQRVIIADFDLDGKVDIFIPGFSDGAMIYAENSVMFWGTGTGFIRENWTDQSMAHGACLGDLNNDGLVDLLVSGSGIWINTGNRHFTLNNSVFANNYFAACAVIREGNTNTIYLSNNNAVAGYNDVIFTYDFQLNLLGSVGYQSDPAYDTINVVVADLSGDGHKDFVISMNGLATNVPGPKRVLAYTAPNTYTSSVTNLVSGRHAFYDHTITINGVDSVFFSGDYLNAKIFKGTTEVYTNIMSTMPNTNSFNPANVYQNASSGKMYMLQLINNTFYTKEIQ
jgi:hypothetical protein